MKNIVAIKERVLFHMDRTRSPRFTNERLTHALQTATSDFVNDRYDNIKDAIARYAFETVQRIRDEIRTIVEIVNLVPVNKVVSLPGDYMFDVGVKMNINGVWRTSIPKSISERIGGERNLYGRPTLEYPIHEEVGSQLRAFLPRFNTFTAIELYYIRQYALPAITDTVISAGTNVLTTGVTYHVEGASVTYNGTTYAPTDTFTAGTILTFTGSGTVRVITDIELPSVTHEEIARRSAAILSGIVENFNRNQVKEVEIKKQ